MPVHSCLPLEVFDHTDGDGKLGFGWWILLAVDIEETAELNDALTAAMGLYWVGPASQLLDGPANSMD